MSKPPIDFPELELQKAKALIRLKALANARQVFTNVPQVLTNAPQILENVPKIQWLSLFGEIEDFFKDFASVFEKSKKVVLENEENKQLQKMKDILRYYKTMGIVFNPNTATNRLSIEQFYYEEDYFRQINNNDENWVQIDQKLGSLELEEEGSLFQPKGMGELDSNLFANSWESDLKLLELDFLEGALLENPVESELNLWR